MRVHAQMMMANSEEAFSLVNSITSVSSQGFRESASAAHPSEGPASTKATLSYWLNIATGSNGFEIRGGDGTDLCTASTVNDAISFTYRPGGVFNASVSKTGLSLEDAWHHSVIVIDTTLATAADRFKLYIDGIRQTGVTSTNPSQNAAMFYGKVSDWTTLWWASSTSNAKVAAVQVIDGQALLPTDFAFDDAGTWTAKKYAGVFGTNGIEHLFEDDTSFTTLGVDSSGNGFDIEINNLLGSSTDVPPFG